VYCALVVTGMLLFGIPGPSLEQAAWVSGSALVLSIALDAARARLRNYLDRRFRKDKSQLDHILKQLGTAVDQLADARTLAQRLLQVSTELHGYPRGCVYLRDAATGDFVRAAVQGVDSVAMRVAASSELVAALQGRPLVDRLDWPPMHPVRQALADVRGDTVLALSHEHNLVGLLVLARGPGQTRRAGDAALLSSFAPIAASALAGAEVRQAVEALNRDLQSKVEKISEQQRRIFSLQQQLIAQSRRYPAPLPESMVPIPPSESADLSSIVGSSAALQSVLELVPKVAANTSAVLIRGESGTGKELIAQALHELSPRCNGPFVKVHCAALAPGVLESELFGHVKGAFTGALRDKPGRFEAANGGTLFLDEIGDISPDVQSKLLRVLQEKTFERVGSNEAVRVDVRLVTATHQDLERLIRDNRFRADLYYRLNVITLHMPPLRERGEDVIELAHHVLGKHAARCGKAVEAIDDDALVALREYPWPGNIRELENVIERAIVVCEGATITTADLPPEVARPQTRGGSARPGRSEGSPSTAVQKARQARFARERSEILQALDRAGGNKSEAAQALGLARSTLLNRMKKYGIADNAATWRSPRAT
jgi:transcriptional regulator with GAF, ATPase, and Fis domain